MENVTAKKPDDYVIATGKNFSVRYFIKKCFKEIKIDLIWKGKGIKEVGINKKTKKVLVRVDKNYFRPSEVYNLRGDFRKAKKFLKWRPIITIDNLIKEMLLEDINELS